MNFPPIPLHPVATPRVRRNGLRDQVGEVQAIRPVDSQQALEGQPQSAQTAVDEDFSIEAGPQGLEVGVRTEGGPVLQRFPAQTVLETAERIQCLLRQRDHRRPIPHRS
ncbi:MAG: hypothetical protein ACPHCJ_07150 [Oceanococcaceae bacterium]